MGEHGRGCGERRKGRKGAVGGFGGGDGLRRPCGRGGGGGVALFGPGYRPVVTLVGRLEGKLSLLGGDWGGGGVGLRLGLGGGAFGPPKTATAIRPPPPTKTDTRKGAEKKDDRPEDPIVATVVHLPYPTGVEKATVRAIHGRKCGAVWVEYPGGTTVYEVARPLLFPTLEEAERYREEARAGKKKPKPPVPTNEENNPPNANPTTEPH